MTIGDIGTKIVSTSNISLFSIYPSIHNGQYYRLCLWPVYNSFSRYDFKLNVEDVGNILCTGIDGIDSDVFAQKTFTDLGSRFYLADDLSFH